VTQTSQRWLEQINGLVAKLVSIFVEVGKKREEREKKLSSYSSIKLNMDA
jgi:hypothetical protein